MAVPTTYIVGEKQTHLEQSTSGCRHEVSAPGLHAGKQAQQARQAVRCAGGAHLLQQAGLPQRHRLQAVRPPGVHVRRQLPGRQMEQRDAHRIRVGRRQIQATAAVQQVLEGLQACVRVRQADPCWRGACSFRLLLRILRHSQSYHRPMHRRAP